MIARILLILGLTVATSVGQELTFHKSPKPLSEKATTSPWHRFLGPNDDCTTPETHLIDEFPEDGPTKVWERTKGSGYTTPVIVDGQMVMFDRFGEEEVVECLHPETGKAIWKFAYPVEYRDRYGFKNGPRASAVIDSGKVYTLGVTSVMTCLDLKTGEKVWQRDLQKEYDVAPYFFGHGSCPIVYDGKVIINLGGLKDKYCVVALDQKTGEEIWGTKHEWLASYSSPVVKELQGEARLLVFAGGESRPSFGGLMAIDPKTGKLFDTFAWRSKKYESVNSSTPIVVGKDRVFISECYEIGGAMLEFTSDLKWKKLWDAPGFNLHWMTPVQDEGELYGFPGRNEPDAHLGSFNIETGKENWKESIFWEIEVGSRKDYRMSYLRGSILKADSKYFALGELGSFAILNLNKEGFEEKSRSQLFLARSTWSLPVVHKGLLYISQHESSATGESPRVICYDLRKP